MSVINYEWKAPDNDSGLSHFVIRYWHIFFYQSPIERQTPMIEYKSNQKNYSYELVDIVQGDCYDSGLYQYDRNGTLQNNVGFGTTNTCKFIHLIKKTL